MKYINIACGDTFVTNEVWVNLDFNHVSPSVTKANLLARLPFEDQSVDAIYSSHFIEHIPKNKMSAFLKECNRVLKMGGVLRLVTPDFEELCTSYLELRKNGESKKADFVMMEIIDQCVRTTSGGELGEYYNTLSDTSMFNFIEERTGQKLPVTHGKRQNDFKTLFSLCRKKFQYLYIKFLSHLFPAPFRMQNISFTDVGERHTWLYDFHTLKDYLSQNGFKDIKKMDSQTSQISNFNFQPLDVNANGSPRKGKESMFVEAFK